MYSCNFLELHVVHDTISYNTPSMMPVCVCSMWWRAARAWGGRGNGMWCGAVTLLFGLCVHVHSLVSLCVVSLQVLSRWVSEHGPIDMHTKLQSIGVPSSFDENLHPSNSMLASSGLLIAHNMDPWRVLCSCWGCPKLNPAASQRDQEPWQT